ncbi:DUF262 domain-containing protein [Saccharothrix sp. S26]|uniref:GmrSD restriction endonuclease domain-containing protein n=1 Tax=Saccharothrix sp. S26 TaxID=2907215 RepID=UPI001F47846F|nr:DUF262 domain-containing protein [Saccharothrix sp. S26]MCE6995617.1 DUF262 domain-containing protein [Saccharothrix sp. S26]
MSDTDTSTKTSVRDPRPSPERLTQLAQRVIDGDILLPRFQRQFVWKRSQIIDLLDSVRRNYPIGSLLLWQTRQKLASERSIADLAINETKPDYPVNYLLDGQQRLSTICGALFWSGSKADSVWNIAFDLRSRKFVHLDTLDEPPAHLIPTRYLANPSQYFMRIVSLSTEMQAEARALFDRFTDYQTAIVTLGDMSIQDVGPVFERINSTGTRLTVVDLMRAATWSPEFDLVDKIDGILSDLEPKKFSGIERKTVLRAVAAASGTGFSADDMDSLRNLDAEALNDLVTNTTEAAKRAADFLSTQIGVTGDAALPYANQFAVLTEVFRRVPHPTAEQFAAIRKWFWITTFSSYFGGWNTGNMASDYTAVQAFAEGASGIDNSSVPPQDSVWRQRDFRSNSATSKMLALFLAQRGPVDLLTGQKIDVGKSLSWSNDKEFHHLFPRAYVTREISGGKPNKVANIIMLTSLSNIKIKDKAPSVYLGEIRKEIGDSKFYARMSASLVSREAADAALVDDYETFLRTRAHDLQALAMELAGIKLAETSEPASDVDLAEDSDVDTTD